MRGLWILKIGLPGTEEFVTVQPSAGSSNLKHISCTSKIGIGRDAERRKMEGARGEGGGRGGGEGEWARGREGRGQRKTGSLSQPVTIPLSAAFLSLAGRSRCSRRRGTAEETRWIPFNEATTFLNTSRLLDAPPSPTCICAESCACADKSKSSPKQRCGPGG
jgi:hypothetical protein